MKSLTLKELININKITLEDVINTTGLSRTTISGIYNETYRVSKKIRDIFKEHYEIYLIDKRFVEDNSKDSKSTEILKIANSEIDAKIKELEEIKNKNNFNIKLNYILENSDALYNDSQFKLAIDRLCEYIETQANSKTEQQVEKQVSKKRQKIEKNNEIEIKTQPVQIVENEKQDKEIKEDKPEEISSSKENDSNLEQTSEIDIEDCSYIYDDADNNPLDTYYPNEEEYGEYDSNEDF